MNELKVWVDAKERIIRGVNEDTSCESVILALAKAAGKSGKLALLERWRDYERILPPDESPLVCVQSWGAYQTQVSLILQDEETPSTINHVNKSPISSASDDKHGLIKRSIDCESLENLTALQERKLQRLSRAIEILDLQFSCWDENEEAFLYLTEDEITEDLSVKLGRALKLQAKELVELDTWQTELSKLQKTHNKLISLREVSGNEISNLEAEIAEACGTIKTLVEERRKMRDKVKEEAKRNSRSSHTREELDFATRELEQQNVLFLNQDQEFDSIGSSFSELDTILQRKNAEIRQLKTEIKSNAGIFLENFLPKIPEAESKSSNTDVGLSDSESADSSEGVQDEMASTSSTIEIESGSELKQSRDELYHHLPNTEILTTEEILQHSPVLQSPGKYSTSSQRHDEMDDLLSNTEILTTEKILQHFPVSKSPGKSSTSSQFHLSNGLKEKHTGYSKFNSKDKNNIRSLGEFENGPILNPNSTFPRELRPVSPLGVNMTSSSSIKYTPSIPTSLSKIGSAIPYKKTLPQASSNISNAQSQKKGSFTRISYDKQETNVSNLVSSTKEKLPKQDIVRNVSKPLIKPKPKRNHILVPQIGNTSLPSTHQNFVDESIYSSRDGTIFVPAPKHYASCSTKSGVTSKVSMQPSPHGRPSRSHLTPPTASYKRSQSRKEKLISNGNSAEQGVFV